MTLFRSLATAALGAVLAFGPGHGGPQAHAQSSGDTAEALGAMRAVFYHELGHGLIDLLDINYVGTEETVADEFSTMLLILQGRRDNRQIEALLSTARFWALISNPTEETKHFYDTHDFNEKRFFNIVCLLHGSDPGRFYPIMTELEIPSNRARRCEFEYREKAQNWVNILTPHMKGNAPADRDGTYRVGYGPAGDDEAHAVSRIWKQTRFLEGLAAEAADLFALPADIPVQARECGQANAYWDGAAITLCYELHSAIAQAFAEARGDGGIASAAEVPAAATRASAAAAPVAAPVVAVPPAASSAPATGTGTGSGTGTGAGTGTGTGAGGASAGGGGAAGALDLTPGSAGSGATINLGDMLGGGN